MSNDKFKIIAKSNVKESYLMAYINRMDVGFIADFENGVLSPDGLIPSLRKGGVWIDFRCSDNIKKRILEQVDLLKAAADKQTSST